MNKCNSKAFGLLKLHFQRSECHCSR